MARIYDHTSIQYRNRWEIAGKNKYNGAYYYSQEIVKNIIPRVKTDRSWMTVNIPNIGTDHSIVFVHNNRNPENYKWLKRFNDVVLVCGRPETVEKLKAEGFDQVIYLPLSIDVKEVKGHKASEKTREVAFAGRPGKHGKNYEGINLPEGIDYLEGIPRGQLLDKMAEYKKIYAVGRTAIEAKALGCEVLAYDPRYPDPDVWEVIDNKDAAKILQEELDKIDSDTKDTAEPVPGVEVEEIEKEEPEEIEIPELTMENTKAEMLDYCKAEKISGVSDKMKKADILQIIHEAQGEKE